MEESQLSGSRPWEAALPDQADHGGSADSLEVGVKRVTLNSGHDIELPVPGITVVVGANNVGKSALLRQVVELLQYLPGSPAGRGVSPSRITTASELWFTR